MDYNAYEILGLTTSATRDEIDAKYKELRDKYQRDRFLPGEEGEDAAEKLQHIGIFWHQAINRSKLSRLLATKATNKSNA